MSIPKNDVVIATVNNFAVDYICEVIVNVIVIGQLEHNVVGNCN